MSLNVTNFGAQGNAVSFLATTVSNSSVIRVLGTNQFASSDVGKVIQVFRAGPWIYYGGSPLVTNQDIICLITNVVNGTNLYISIPAGWTSNSVYCVAGANNANAFQAAINSASNSIAKGQATNVTVQIPAGTYFLISSNALNPNYVMQSIADTQPAVIISSGGITLAGASATNTILMGCGAGMNHQVLASAMYPAGEAPYVPYRGCLIYCQGPVVNSQYPLIFQNLTFDGGLTNGLQSYNYWTILQGNGAGWDMTHDAVMEFDASGANAQMHQLKIFANCVFQHWRGEIVKSVVGNGGTNTFINITNCVFNDGNASAINITFGHHVQYCSFSNLVKVLELYEDYPTLPMTFEHSLWTNIVSNPFTIVGATTNHVPQPYLLCNNVLAGASGTYQITFSPAENVTVSNNNFYGPAIGVASTAAGLQPSDGSAAIVSNIVVCFNSFNDTHIPIYTDGYSARNFIVTNNSSSCPSCFGILAAGWKTNFVFKANSGTMPVNASGVSEGQWPYDDPANLFGPVQINAWQGGSNNISYATGGRYQIVYLGTSNPVFYLDDSQPGLMPPGALLYITNSCSAQSAPVYLSSTTPAAQVQVQPGSMMTFLWTNGGWSNQVQRPLPPTNLHVISGN